MSAPGMHVDMAESTPRLDPLILAPIVSRVRTDVHWEKRNGTTRLVKAPLTEKHVVQHLDGGTACGCCPIMAGENSTRLAVLDLDSHNGETPWGEMQSTAQLVVDALHARELHPVAFRSSGGRGIHIYLLWDEAQDAYSVREFLAGVLAELGYRNGTKGIAAREIEIFPKQDAVSANGYGNMFILPLAGASEPLDSMTGLPEPMGKQWAALLDWRSSPPVPLVTMEVRSSVVEVCPSVELRHLQSALAAIPNEGEQELDYDTWRNVIFAIHYETEGSDEGLQLAHEFSSRASKYDPDFLDGRVWPYIKHDRERPITGGTLLKLAREAGWTDCTADEFEVIPTAPTAEGAPVELPPFKRNNKGEILATKENVTLALRRPDLCSRQLRHDEFRDEIMVAPAGTDEWRAFRDSDYHELCIVLERGEQGFRDIPKERIRDAVGYVAEANTFDSARHWLTAQKWDGVPRVASFLSNYMGAEDTPYTRAIGLYLWTALAGRVAEPGIKADMVPVAVGAQGVLKSTTVAAIVPAPEYFLELDLGGKDEDLARLMRGKLVIELGELKGLRAREMEHVKAFISRSHESWVPKFKEMPATYARRAVFFGTTNKDEFLIDDTGHRRWLPFQVSKCDPQATARDRSLLWAEGRELFAAHGVMWQEAERLARGEHDKFVVRDAWEEIVEQWLTTPDEISGGRPCEKPFTAVDALMHGVRMDARNINQSAKDRMSRVLKELGCTAKRLRINKIQVRAYVFDR